MSYSTLILIHIGSMLLLLGVGGGSAFYKFMADRSGDIDIILHTNKLVVLADWLFTTPSAILQPLTGIWLIQTLGLPYTTPWLLTSILLYLFSGTLWLIAVWLQLRMKHLAQEAKEKQTALPDKYHRLVRQWIWLGIFSFVAMGSILVLMVVKPNMGILFGL